MQVEKVLELITAALEEKKGEELLRLDVRGKTDLMDYMVLVSGTSKRHVAALVRNLLDRLEEAGLKPLGVEGEQDQEWILVDVGDVVVHVMLPEKREFYQLERLWGMEWEEELPSTVGSP